jgi:hypothetical protein
LVPYLGASEPYFLGNGVVGAGGNTRGDWDFLIGPDYTSPNFITKETLGVNLDGVFHALHPEMHRVRGAGIFTGAERIGECEVSVTDFTTSDDGVVTRFIRAKNLSKTRAIQVQFVAKVTPTAAKGVTAKQEGRDTLRIVADTSSFDFGGETRSSASRSAGITFNETCDASKLEGAWLLKTRGRTANAGVTLSVGLNHLEQYGNGPFKPSIRASGYEANLAESVRDWRSWLSSGKKLAIPDAKARDIVESSLIACKMQQDQDGGTIAGPRKYANSYIRDSHGALRLFLATGHINEAEAIIRTIYHRWTIAGFIPNYWSMGSYEFIGHSFASDSSEITGYFVLMIRDAYEATGSLAFVNSVADGMKYAVDAQLDFMEAHGGRLTFNGDETEQYCDTADGQVYGGFPAFSEWRGNNWSFASAALAVASTQFYIDYLNLKHRHAEAVRYEERLHSVRDSIDGTFLRNGIHAWMRTRDDKWPTETVTNYDLIPLWAGARLNRNGQNSDALAMKKFIDPKSGFLPTAPPVVEGFCGHNLGYLLYDMVTLHDPVAPAVFRTMMNSTLYGCWGTVSEFYGPHGVPNGHNFRVFESGIDAEAIIRYFTPPHIR